LHIRSSGKEVSGLRLYEILLTIDPRLSDEEANQLLTRLQDGAKELGAEVHGVDNWGRRRLAYAIRKQREGIYAVLELDTDTAALKEFERQLKLNESVLRFLSARVPSRKKAQQPKAQSELEEVV
jgi:small subunit ribosomal protein S6